MPSEISQLRAEVNQLREQIAELRGELRQMTPQHYLLETKIDVIRVRFDEARREHAAQLLRLIELLAPHPKSKRAATRMRSPRKG